MSSPACAAGGSLVATMPCRARTSDRPCDSHPCARDPGTALTMAPGCGTSADGTPKALGDCALGAASITTRAVTAAAERMMAWRRYFSMGEILQPTEGQAL